VNAYLLSYITKPEVKLKKIMILLLKQGFSHEYC